MSIKIFGLATEAVAAAHWLLANREGHLDWLQEKPGVVGFAFDLDDDPPPEGWLAEACRAIGGNPENIEIIITAE